MVTTWLMNGTAMIVPSPAGGRQHRLDDSRRERPQRRRQVRHPVAQYTTGMVNAWLMNGTSMNSSTTLLGAGKHCLGSHEQVTKDAFLSEPGVARCDATYPERIIS